MIRQGFTGERALFGSRNLEIVDCTFYDGESPLKESANLSLDGCLFKWKYPLWYCNGVKVNKCTLFNTARAGIWYTDGIEVTDTLIEAPKSFRRASGITLDRVTFTNAAETLWNCKNVKMNRVVVNNGDYFAMNCVNVDTDGLELVGNYAFDGAKNITIRNSKLLTKDAFWNSENITVYDSFISGEYLGWNSKNLTLVNCTVESLQGMCYIANLTMKNCKLINTTLAFEYSTVDADISGKIDSVLNPSGGRITAEYIDELILEKDKIDPAKTVIVCRKSN